MSVDIDQQLRALGQHLEHDAPEVGIDDVLSRRPSGRVMRDSDADTPSGPASAELNDRSPVRRRSTLLAAAVVATTGLFGLVVVANRATSDEPDPPGTAPIATTTETTASEPAVFPIVGERAQPMDLGAQPDR